MRTLAAVALLAPLLAGCTELNTSLGSMQFSGATDPLPSDYARQAAQVVAGYPVAPGGLSISGPMKLVGATTLDPWRWYVCVRGIKPPQPGEVIVIFQHNLVATAITYKDAPLCAGANFVPLAPAK